MNVAALASGDYLAETDARMSEDKTKPELATGDADAAPNEPPQGFSNKYLAAMASQILNREIFCSLIYLVKREG